MLPTLNPPHQPASRAYLVLVDKSLRVVGREIVNLNSSTI